MRNMNNLLQIRYFGLITRFYSLNNALFASQNHAISLKISDFRDDSHTPHRLLSSKICVKSLQLVGNLPNFKALFVLYS